MQLTFVLYYTHMMLNPALHDERYKYDKDVWITSAMLEYRQRCTDGGEAAFAIEITEWLATAVLMIAEPNL